MYKMSSILSLSKKNEIKYSDDEIVFQNFNELSMKELKDFLKNPEFKAVKGDKEMNYWSVGGTFGLYKLPVDSIEKFFKLYDNCRINGLRLNFMERQSNGGIFHDFDIYQKDQKDCLTATIIYKIIQEICEVCKEMINFSNIIGDRVIHIPITKRPLVEWDEDKKAWKNGLHIYIPSIKLEDKTSRQLILINMKKRKIIEDIVGKYVIDSEVSNIIDIASAWVPPLLFGSAKPGKEPYILNNIYKMIIDQSGDYILQNDTELITYNNEQIALKSKSATKKKKTNNDNDDNDNDNDEDEYKTKQITKINLSQEFSTTCPSKYIESHSYKLKASYNQDIDRMRLKASTRENRDDDETDLVNMYNALSYLTISDHNAEYIKDILDMLPKKYYDKYTLWFKVIYILANTCVLYKPLAKWFSRKSSKWQSSEQFDSKWEEALYGQRYSLHITHLYKWARKYNKTKYIELDKSSAYRLVHNNSFDPIIEGDLQHDHFAKILDILLKNKYVSDSADKSNKKFLWYEFIFPDSKSRPGQVYKWAEIENPTNMYIYISEHIPNLMKQVMETIKNQMKNVEEKELRNYYKKIVSNLQKAGRKLSNNTFREQVVKSASMRFLKPNFAKELNQHEYTIGVGNGILKLSSVGALPTLVKQYNDLNVSHYTETMYVEFDPNDPVTQKILLALRTRHPNDHTDVYEYVMGYHAASIDHRPRAHLMLLINGPGRNGKSFGSELHKNMLGDTYGRAMPVTMLITEESGPGAADPVLLCTKDARYCMYSEGPKCVSLYTPRVKRMTGGDTQTARQLYSGDVEQFNPRCHHVAFSNFDFEINESGFAIWERVRYVLFPMTFKSEHDYNPADPYQRILDHSLNDVFVQKAETKAKYLSIMVFYHMKLMHHYGGLVDKIPHPTVRKMTMQFQIEQDTIAKFAQQHLVRMAPGAKDDSDTEPPMRSITLTKKYISWYSSNIKEKSNLQPGYIEKTIKESLFKKYLKDSHGVYFLKKGYRIRESEVEALQEGETMEISLSNGDENIDSSKENYFKSETPLEFLERVKQEWEVLKIHNQKIKASANGINEYDDFNEEGDISDPEDIDDSSNPTESLANISKSTTFQMDGGVLDDILRGKTPYAKYNTEQPELEETDPEDQYDDQKEEQSEENMVDLISFL